MTIERDTRLAGWFREWKQPLRRYLLKRQRGAAADVDDIAQEVFLRLLRFDRADLVAHPQAYLYKVAANVSVEWSARASSRLQHSAEWLDDLAEVATPEDEAHREETNRQLKAALLTLPARHREILRLHFEEGLTYDEVAARLQLSHRVVKRDLSSAYAALRRLLPDALLGPHGRSMGGSSEGAT